MKILDPVCKIKTLPVLSIARHHMLSPREFHSGGTEPDCLLDVIMRKRKYDPNNGWADRHWTNFIAMLAMSQKAMDILSQKSIWRLHTPLSQELNLECRHSIAGEGAVTVVPWTSIPFLAIMGQYTLKQLVV
jgi:hypothetical protein